ncbi:MatE [Desulforapulum autotrophicum HRM2]|uniref:MatE n=1 Tax=Desulforapulum autotrophicum (strain ATCC 43914 / DSM 3382 / VKM B-1955 / HRM2) TaxID=177437 RepID=C0QAR7_DESAH|nr:MATE family efflux transporter [Desulforapulum autotrophicum]ACN16850.1 MatE [Desulforapulum autotrophicum HRM2]
MGVKPLNMGKGKVLTVLLGLGAPAMVSMFFQNLYALVDTIFVAWLGTIELAALSLSVPMLYLAMAVAKGVAVGATSLMSHARGSNDADKADRVTRSCLPLALILLAPFCLLALPGVNATIFRGFNVDQGVLESVQKFMFWLGWTFPAMGFAMVCESVFLSHGDARTPMKAMILGNIINIALDPFLIFYCKMGIAGASLSSLVGWAISGFFMWFTLKHQGKVSPQCFCTPGEARVWKEIGALGGPVALAILIMPISVIGLNYVLTPFGPAYVGAWALSARMEQMIILPLYGLSCSLIPFAGFNLGAGNSDRIREAVRISIMACYGVLLPVGALLWFNAPFVIGMFQPGSEVLELSTYAFRASLLGYWLVPIELIVIGLAQGLKRPRYTLIINVARLLLLRLPLAFLLGYIWGGKGAYVSHALAMMVTGTVSIFILGRLLTLADKSCAPLSAQKS